MLKYSLWTRTITHVTTVKQQQSSSGSVGSEVEEDSEPGVNREQEPADTQKADGTKAPTGTKPELAKPQISHSKSWSNSQNKQTTVSSEERKQL